MASWTFGVEPLPQAREIAPLLRRVTGLIQALEHDEPAVLEADEIGARHGDVDVAVNADASPPFSR